ncbi:MAG: ABC transporter ATP-binding protein/permease [Candidatus Yanofskybacteria bacterium]|nr:ABC transporter ATP-binding protein/permease [Candidatus Yanofskybacteria bacterium]
MKLLIQFIRRQKKLLFLALFLATINQVFSLLDPQIFRLIVDKYASHATSLSKQEFFSGVVLLLLASMGVAFVSRVAKNFQDYYVSIVTQRVGANLYAKSITHSFSLPYSAFEDQRSGELLQKLQKARTDSQSLIQSFIGVLFLTLVGIVFVLWYAFSVHWLIGLLYLLVVPSMGLVMFLLTRSIKNAQKAIVTESASLAGSTTETLRNVELVKSLGLEKQETQRLNETNEKILGLELKKIKRIRLLSFIQGTLINTIRSALLLLMMWLIFQKQITFGQFFSLYFYLFFIFGPLQELGRVSNEYQETKASMEKLQQILDIQPEEKPEHPKHISHIQSIKLNDVSFSYDNGTPSLANITMDIKGGNTVALVGPSGAGKSTMVKLLVGLYKPKEGSIVINDTDTSELDYDHLRASIGYVSQETQLFAGSIRENLLFVSPQATDEECLDVLKKASAMAIIERGGKGLDTRIGEGGIKISGGERQRLAIARSLLRKPSLIIFDEATSSLDSITEKEITQTIKDITNQNPDLITISVAHRLSTIAHADTIYVLEQGKIVEAGNHKDLLEKRGLYAAMWREQGAEL